MSPVAPRNVSDVSYVRRISHESHFTWQVQYLVRLEFDACFSAHCKYVSYVKGIHDESHFSWQVQYLVMLEDESCCSAHCTGRFMRDKDQSSESCFPAGAIFGEVRG